MNRLISLRGFTMSSNTENAFEGQEWKLTTQCAYAKQGAALKIESADGHAGVYVYQIDVAAWKSNDGLDDKDLREIFGKNPTDGSFVVVDSDNGATVCTDLKHAREVAKEFTNVSFPVRMTMMLGMYLAQKLESQNANS